MNTHEPARIGLSPASAEHAGSDISHELANVLYNSVRVWNLRTVGRGGSERDIKGVLESLLDDGGVPREDPHDFRGKLIPQRPIEEREQLVVKFVVDHLIPAMNERFGLDITVGNGEGQ